MRKETASLRIVICWNLSMSCAHRMYRPFPSMTNALSRPARFVKPAGSDGERAPTGYALCSQSHRRSEKNGEFAPPAGRYSGEILTLQLQGAADPGGEPDHTGRP